MSHKYFWKHWIIVVNWVFRTTFAWFIEENISFFFKTRVLIPQILSKIILAKHLFIISQAACLFIPASDKKGMSDSDNQKLTELLRLEDCLVQPLCLVRDIQTRYPGLCAEDFEISPRMETCPGYRGKRGVEYLAEFNSIPLFFVFCINKVAFTVHFSYFIAVSLWLIGCFLIK